MVYLVLSHLGDLTAPRVAEALAARHGADAVCALSDFDLTAHGIWRHYLSSEETGFKLILPSGVQLQKGNVSAVYNRLRYTFVPHFANAKSADREYAVMEIFAFMLSWLESMGPRVVNRASSQGLGGSTIHPVVWQSMAAEAGLPIEASRITNNLRRFQSAKRRESTFFAQTIPGSQPGLPVSPRPGWLQDHPGGDWTTITLIGGRVFGALPSRLHAGALQLARRSGYDVLGMQFAWDGDGQWRFLGADPFVELENAAQIDALVALMERVRQPELELAQ